MWRTGKIVVERKMRPADPSHVSVSTTQIATEAKMGRRKIMNK